MSTSRGYYYKNMMLVFYLYLEFFREKGIGLGDRQINFYHIYSNIAITISESSNYRVLQEC